MTQEPQRFYWNQLFMLPMFAVLVRFMLNDIPHAMFPEEEYELRGYRVAKFRPARVLYHVTPRENVSSIMSEGLYAPVHLLTDVDIAHRWKARVEEDEPASILIATLPGDWIVHDDPLHPKGVAIVSEEHVPAKYLAVLRNENTASKNPPTPAQLRYISQLCQQLRIERPIEEEVKTQGEAGRWIRELEAEREYRKQR